MNNCLIRFNLLCCAVAPFHWSWVLPGELAPHVCLSEADVSPQRLGKVGWRRLSTRRSWFGYGFRTKARTACRRCWLFGSDCYGGWLAPRINQREFRQGRTAGTVSYGSVAARSVASGGSVWDWSGMVPRVRRTSVLKSAKILRTVDNLLLLLLQWDCCPPSARRRVNQYLLRYYRRGVARARACRFLRYENNDFISYVTTL